MVIDHANQNATNESATGVSCWPVIGPEIALPSVSHSDPAWFSHDSILSRNGVSGNPGAVHLRKGSLTGGSRIGRWYRTIQALLVQGQLDPRVGRRLK